MKTDCNGQFDIFGGLKTGSIPILKALFSIFGIRLSNRGHPVSKHGLVLTSINHGRYYSSNIKS